MRPPLTLKWRKGKDTPIKMSTSVQSVVIGDSVYVSGGDTSSDCDGCTVLKLDFQQEEWTRLPLYFSKWFALTSLNDQPVLVGGVDAVKSWKRNGEVAVLDHVSGRWTHPYPPMNIARHSSTAVCYNNHIIVVGGDDGHSISSAEVLDVIARKWHIAESLPIPWISLKSTWIENTLYLMGGWSHTTGPTKAVQKIDLNKLIKNTVSEKAIPNLWQAIPDAPLKYSAPLSVGSSLLAFGGRDDFDNPSSSIHLYQSETCKWIKVGDLPSARYNCTCSILSNEEVFIAAGMPRNAVDFVLFK